MNQAVQLTDAVAGARPGGRAPDGIVTGPFISGFTARFNATIGPKSGDVPADGMSFSVGDLGSGEWGEGWRGLNPQPSRSGSIPTTMAWALCGNIGIHLWVNGRIGLQRHQPLHQRCRGASGSQLRHDDGSDGEIQRRGHFQQRRAPGFSFETGDRFSFGGRTGGFNERNVLMTWRSPRDDMTGSSAIVIAPRLAGSNAAGQL